MNSSDLITAIVRLNRPDLPWNATREQVYQAARDMVYRFSGGASVS